MLEQFRAHSEMVGGASLNVDDALAKLRNMPPLDTSGLDRDIADKIKGSMKAVGTTLEEARTKTETYLESFKDAQHVDVSAIHAELHKIRDDAINSNTNNIKSAFGELDKQLDRNPDSAKSVKKAGFAIKMAIDLVGGCLVSAIMWVVTHLAEVWEKLKEAGKWVWEHLKSAAESVWHWITHL
jgi:hypothetical protein